MEFKHLLFSVEEQIATVTINRPKALNALNMELLLELTQLFDHIKNNASIQAVVLTGSGEKAFVAGADISEMQSKTAPEAKGFSTIGNELMSKIENLPQPVIAAVNGYALGGGSELALACDLRIASIDAKLGQPEVTLGIVAGFGGSQRLPRLVGPSIAKELLMTGEMITAERAYQIGLVNHVVESDALLDKAKSIARKMISNSIIGIQASKKLVNEGFEMDIQRALSLEAETFGMMFATEDQKEGMAAFLDKRKAQFKAK
ncbi:enoyl-CoA hydratase-related protein [Metabacillus herbersteinensis]|uniref:Enoyl-CoA hydratase-related protein n=1 Tax=Metabacillus herbersteinensis TaxID=283816 RepID=A0ABV6GHT5_9BACI